jgi:hypothetical protein
MNESWDLKIESVFQKYPVSLDAVGALLEDLFTIYNENKTLNQMDELSDNDDDDDDIQTNIPLGVSLIQLSD